MARPPARMMDLTLLADSDEGRRDAATDSGPASIERAPAPIASRSTAPIQRQPPHGTMHRRSRTMAAASSSLDSSDFINIDPSQLHVDSDSSDSDFRSSRLSAKGPSHTRSSSNPFPSLFSSKKTVQNDTSLGWMDSRLSDEDLPTIPHRNRHGDSQQTGRDLLTPAAVFRDRRPSSSTGPCITCGSLMRWSHGVDAFRCGICLTINDLVPDGKLPAQEHFPSTQRAATDQISVDQTRVVIENCLRAYLTKALSDGPVDERPYMHSDQLPSHVFAHNVTCSGEDAVLEAKESDGSVIYAAQSNIDGRVHKSPSGDDTAHLRLAIRPKTGHEREPKVGHRAHPSKSLSSNPVISVSGPSHDSHASLGSLQHEMSNTPSRPRASGLKPISSASTHTGSDLRTGKNQEYKEAKRIFLTLEDYLLSHILSTECLDGSFLTHNERGVSPGTHEPSLGKRRATSSTRPSGGSASFPRTEPSVSMTKDTNVRAGRSIVRSAGHRHVDEERNKSGTRTSRPILIDWPSVDEWYSAIVNAGENWQDIYMQLVNSGKCPRQPNSRLEHIEAQILTGQEHAQKTLLKAIETVLKRPGRRISELGDFRFLIIVLANPLLHSSCKSFCGIFQHRQPQAKTESRRGTGPASGQHSVIIKRILGLMSHSSDEWHNRMITCFAQFSEARFLKTRELVSQFLVYRLIRHNERIKESKNAIVSDPLVPEVPEGASAASFHAALSQASRAAKKTSQPKEKNITHGDDWQVVAAARVLGLLFAANNKGGKYRHGMHALNMLLTRHAGTGSRAQVRGQILPTSDFYITLLDNCDLVGDFEAWEQHATKFAFCQYPFLLSVWAKIQILEHEARRQMKNKARDAFFDSIMTRRTFDQYLVLSVRRDCLVEDSLKGVSAAIGSSTDDIKKGLRIIFNGEEGIDAGGLRKEWFLLLVRELFNPDHGMFVYDDESHFCYFNPASFETSDQFFLVGVVLGLAIYNSTILDVALPPFAFRKLLLAAPCPTTGFGMALQRPAMSYTLADLAEFRPRLARGLQQLLEFDGDVESTFCLTFTIAIERYGSMATLPLCSEGQTRIVTNANREEYVNLYVRYLLDTSVSRQFEPFKRGFFSVCGCNALGLFRPEEIELLVRGSDEPLDIASLRLAASYENWKTPTPHETEPTIRWLWEMFEEASPHDQRKLLIFITGSDRIPATGPASLSIRILCLGNDLGRFPTARTCFNTLTLYRYTSKERMHRMLWAAVHESEGFGLK